MKELIKENNEYINIWKNYFLDLLKIVGIIGTLIGIIYQSVTLIRFGNNLSFFSYSQAINDSIIFFIILLITIIIGSTIIGILVLFFNDDKNKTYKKIIALLFGIFIYVFFNYGFLSFNFDLSILDGISPFAIIIYYTLLNSFLLWVIIDSINNNLSKNKGFFIMLCIGFILLNALFFIFSYSQSYNIVDKEGNKYISVYMNDSIVIVKDNYFINNDFYNVLFQNNIFGLLYIKRDYYSSDGKKLYGKNEVISLNKKDSYKVIYRKNINTYKNVLDLPLFFKNKKLDFLSIKEFEKTNEYKQLIKKLGN